MIRALLVDDDLELVRLLEDYFRAHDVALTHAQNGADAFDRLRRQSFDVVFLDVMLPDTNGFDLCRRIREVFATVPIVMLTARGDDEDRIRGLELGADDYVPKPFNPRELLARTRAVLRRVAPAVHPAEKVENVEKNGSIDRINVGPLSIDVASRTVRLRGEEVSLTSFEYRILSVLARRAGETVTREELAEQARDPAQRGKHDESDAYDPAVDRSLDVHVSRLRQKLEEDPKEPRLIKTVRGVGYVLVRFA